MKKRVAIIASHKSSEKLSSSKTLPKKKSLPAKVSWKATTIPAGHEHKVAEQVLKFVDEASCLLRSGIRDGVATTAKSRIAAKKKAHDLLGKATSELSKAIEGGSSVLQDSSKRSLGSWRSERAA